MSLRCPPFAFLLACVSIQRIHSPRAPPSPSPSRNAHSLSLSHTHAHNTLCKNINRVESIFHRFPSKAATNTGGATDDEQNNRTPKAQTTAGAEGSIPDSKRRNSLARTQAPEGGRITCAERHLVCRGGGFGHYLQSNFLRRRPSHFSSVSPCFFIPSWLVERSGGQTEEVEVVSGLQSASSFKGSPAAP